MSSPEKASAATIAVLITPPMFDGGSIDAGAVLSGQFVLHNASGDPIKLVDSRTSCRCTDVKSQLIGVEIPAGGEFEFEMGLDTVGGTGRMGGSVTIAFVASIPGETGDVKSPVQFTSCRIEADVIAEFKAEPLFLDFERVAKLKSRIIKIISRDSLSNHITGVRCANAVFQVGIVPDKSAVEVTVVPESVTRCQSISSVIYIETDSPRTPTIKVDCKADLVPPIEVKPDVVVARMHSAEPVEQVILLTGASPIQVNHVESSEGIGVSVRPGKTTDSVELVLLISTSASAKSSVTVDVQGIDTSNEILSRSMQVAIPVFVIHVSKGVAAR